METFFWRRGGGALFFLGNYLSGMETMRPRRGGLLRIYSLETSLVEWKPVFRASTASTSSPLGNFLSGMETSTSAPCPLRPRCLGNFLSGMETPATPRPPRRGLRALETSLVEWKPGGA